VVFPRRSQGLLSALIICGLLASAASPAATAASPNEAAAAKLRQQAIYEDYLATNFAEAGKKLSQAIALCEGTTPGCAPAMRARLHCDMGVIDFALLKRDEGRAEFANALDEDPSVALDADVSTSEVQLAFAELKSKRPANKARATIAEPPPTTDAETKAERKGPRKAEPKVETRSDEEHPTPDETDTSDCPPGFPGCHAAGASTEPDSVATELTGFKANWLSLGVQQDLMLVDSKTDACAGGTGYTCFDNGGTYYASSPYPRAGDAVNGGFTMATIRILLGYDRALTANLTLGGRIGFALGGGPARPNGSAFFPLHVEARATYWFGRSPLARSGLRFFALAAAGMAQVDAAMPVNVYDSLEAYRTNQVQHFKAWHKAGLGFGGLGGGAMVAFTPSSGLLLELKVMEMFPTPSSAAGIQLGYAVGM